VTSSLALLLILMAARDKSESTHALASSKFDSNMNMKQQNEERPSEHYPAFFQSLPSMKGKTLVITGCSRGLGYVTAATFAKKGGAVIMLNRPGENARHALEELQKIVAANSDYDAPAPQLVECDLLSFESVRNACEKVKVLTEDTGISVLCNNAGIMLQQDISSKDGYDITASTNMLSHFLITRELLPSLELAATKSGDHSRVVNMSSGSGYSAPAFDSRFFEQQGGNLGGAKDSYERYHQSKLANLAFTVALHDRLNHNGKIQYIQAIACTPGICGTDMFVHATTAMYGKPSPRSTVPSTEAGAMAQLKCIFDPQVQSGELWGPDRNGSLELTPMKPPLILVDEISKRQLWEACEKAVGKFSL